MAQGVVVRFDDAKGYGFITPDGGGEDVFVHVNELASPGTPVACGTRVEFGILDGERGLKAYDVHVVDLPMQATASVTGSHGSGGLPPTGRVAPAGDRTEGAAGEDTCEVFTQDEFSRLATELLLTSSPELTARQVLEIRRSLVRFATDHGWVD